VRYVRTEQAFIVLEGVAGVVYEFDPLDNQYLPQAQPRNYTSLLIFHGLYADYTPA